MLKDMKRSHGRSISAVARFALAVTSSVIRAVKPLMEGASGAAALVLDSQLFEGDDVIPTEQTRKPRTSSSVLQTGLCQYS